MKKATWNKDEIGKDPALKNSKKEMYYEKDNYAADRCKYDGILFPCYCGR